MTRSLALNHAQAQTLWSPQQDETVLWRGKPDALVLARTAFRARIVAGYFLALTALTLVFGGATGAIFMLLAGLATLAIIHGLAYIAARTTTYMLTDRRVILHIGMAIEKTINLPLRQIGAAHLSDRGGGYGEIALEPAAEHTLGYLLLWPHARPWRYARPQPMMRAVPAASAVAEKLAAAVAAHQAIERGEVPTPTPQAGAPSIEVPIEGALA